MHYFNFKQLLFPMALFALFVLCQPQTFAQRKPIQKATPGKTILPKQKIPTANNKLLLHKEDRNAIPDQYIVMLTDEFFPPFIKTGAYKSMRTREAKAKGLANHQRTFNSKLQEELRRTGISPKSVKDYFAGGATGFTAKLTQAQLNALLKFKWVRWIEQDSRFRIIDIISRRRIVNTQVVDWGVKEIGAENTSGIGKYAYVIDSGVDQDHPDLNVNTTLSMSMVDNETSKDDLNGHGTHVAGIIAAKDNLFGTKGVAAGATIVGIKALNQSGSGSWSDVIEATTYASAIAQAGDVVNYSLGGGGSNYTLEWSIRMLLGFRGIYVTIAAGNSNMHATGFTPARTEGANIYTISNMDQAKKITGTSNYGNGPVDYAAPGQNIFSLDKNGGYTTKSDTSMAAPHVAGIILLNNGIIHTNGMSFRIRTIKKTKLPR